MKRKLLVLLLLSLVLTAGAQEREDNAWYLTPRAGINISSLAGSSSTSKSKLGFLAGADLEYIPSESPAGFSAGLFASNENINLMNATAHITYLAAPVCVRYWVVPHFNLFLGAMPKLRVINNADDFEVGISGKAIYSKNQDASVFDVSFPVGFSFDTHHVVFDFRYNIGLSDNMFKSVEGRNKTFSISVGYRFGL